MFDASVHGVRKITTLGVVCEPESEGCPAHARLVLNIETENGPAQVTLFADCAEELAITASLLPRQP